MHETKDEIGKTNESHEPIKDSNIVDVKDVAKPSEPQSVDESSYLSLSQVCIFREIQL